MRPQIKTIWRREWYGHEENQYCVVEPCDICGKIVRPTYRPACYFVETMSKGWPVVYYRELCARCAIGVRRIVKNLKELRELDRLARLLGAPSEIRGLIDRIRVSEGLYIERCV